MVILYLDGVYMTCDFGHVDNTGIISTTYSDLSIKINEFILTARVVLGRRVNIYYKSEDAVRELVASSNICHEVFHIVCLKDNYTDYQLLFLVPCRCRRFVRQTLKDSSSYFSSR